MEKNKTIPAAYLFQLSSLTYGNYKSWPETLASNKSKHKNNNNNNNSNKIKIKF